jgi:methanogenic corrinoid protein MtbC1
MVRASDRWGQDPVRDVDAVAESALSVLYERSVEARRFLKSAPEVCLEDMRHHTLAVAVALDVGDARLLEEYLVWAKSLLAHRGLPDTCLTDAVAALEEALRADSRPGASEAAEMLRSAWAALAEAKPDLPSAIDPADPLASLATAYLEMLLEGDRHGAMQLLADAATEGVRLSDLYDRVLRAVQHEVGRLWQSGRLSVAMEHYITGVNQVLMARLYPIVASTRSDAGPVFVGACVAGERHELGLRMVCDLLELEGWNAVFLGADTPLDAVVAAIGAHRPAVLGLSATLGFNVSAVRRFIAAVRAQVHGGQMFVIVGGRPFDLVPGLWQEIGADSYAPSASEAVRVARSLVA